jgi:hypothetical protein
MGISLRGLDAADRARIAGFILERTSCFRL